MTLLELVNIPFNDNGFFWCILVLSILGLRNIKKAFNELKSNEIQKIKGNIFGGAIPYFVIILAYITLKGL
jgi:hypothetical protein